MSSIVSLSRFRIEKLEERIAPRLASANSPIGYSGPGLTQDGAILVPQDHIGGPGIGDQNPGSADGNGALKTVFITG